MPHRGRKKEWAIVLFGGVLVILFPPVIAIYDRSILVMGVPLSYLVLFALWALVILATALSTRNILPDDPVPDDDDNVGDLADMAQSPQKEPDAP